MTQLSDTAMMALIALALDDRCVVGALRNGDGDDWRAQVEQRERSNGFERTVPIRVFRKLRREGYLTKEGEGHVTEPTDGRLPLIHSKYVLTEKGRAIVRA